MLGLCGCVLNIKHCKHCVFGGPCDGSVGSMSTGQETRLSLTPVGSAGKLDIHTHEPQGHHMSGIGRGHSCEYHLLTYLACLQEGVQ